MGILVIVEGFGGILVIFKFYEVFW